MAGRRRCIWQCSGSAPETVGLMAHAEVPISATASGRLSRLVPGWPNEASSTCLGDAVAMQLDLAPVIHHAFEPTTCSQASRASPAGSASARLFRPAQRAVRRRAHSLFDGCMSNGRAAWNVVTSTINSSALNFGGDRLKDHDLRYEIAEEFVDVVRGLWTPGTTARWSQTGSAACSSIRARCATSITKAAFSR